MRTPRLLFVDDEPNVLRALRRIFLEDDFEIELMESGKEALEYLHQTEVDLILSDHNMPELTGIEFLEQAKEIQPECIRMLITGRGDLEVAMQAINQGSIYKFFNKPWEDEDLRISILRALEYKQTQERIRQHEDALSRFQAYRQTMVTVSHYINNFNCGLIMSLEGLLESQTVNGDHRDLINSSLSAARKIDQVLRILNELQELKIAEYPSTDGMIDIEEEIQKTIRRIENEPSSDET